MKTNQEETPWKKFGEKEADPFQSQNSLDSVLRKLPPKYREAVLSFGEAAVENLEEIRIQAGQTMFLICGGKEYRTKVILSQKEVEGILSAILSYSVYSYQDEIARGYVTLPGGHRVGICGKVIEEGGAVRGIKEISSLNIRRSREIPGAAGLLMRHIMPSGPESVRSCLILSPPGCGKTTLLRDVIRSLSEGGCRMSVVDERSELAGTYQGMAQKDLGPRTDILSGCLKSQGITMLLRAMGPRVICCDEIGSQEDVQAIRQALVSGVKVICTAHGGSYEEITHSALGNLVSQEIFERYFLLGRVPRAGTLLSVYDQKGEEIGW